MDKSNALNVAAIVLGVITAVLGSSALGILAYRIFQKRKYNAESLKAEAEVGKTNIESVKIEAEIGLTRAQEDNTKADALAKFVDMFGELMNDVQALTKAKAEDRLKFDLLIQECLQERDDLKAIVRQSETTLRTEVASLRRNNDESARINAESARRIEALEAKLRVVELKQDNQ